MSSHQSLLDNRSVNTCETVENRASCDLVIKGDQECVKDKDDYVNVTRLDLQGVMSPVIAVLAVLCYLV